MTLANDRQGFLRGIRGSVVGAAILLFWDAVIYGTFTASILFCPIWFLLSLVKNVIQRPGWDLGLLRIGIPALTLGLVLANSAVQLSVAGANAQRVSAACEAFHAANGRFPEKLDELVPKYLPYVPPAKYCLAWSQFWYFGKSHPMLLWHVVPPYNRRYYDFEAHSRYQARE